MRRKSGCMGLSGLGNRAQARRVGVDGEGREQWVRALRSWKSRATGMGFGWWRSGLTCEWCGLAQGAVVRGGEGPRQAGTEGCR